MVTFWPSMKPLSFRPRWNAGTNGHEGDALPRKPITGIGDCCARAASGHAAAAPPRSPMNSRRLMPDTASPLQSVYCTLSLPQSGRQVLWAGLNCSESRAAAGRPRIHVNRQPCVAHGSQLPAERLLGDCDAEFLEDPLRQIDQPPAHHAMHRRDRATLDHAGDGLPLSVVELGRLSCRLAIQETVRTAGVEAQHPVPDDLKSDTADLGRLGARCPIVDSREC